VQKYNPTDPTVSLNAEELPVYVSYILFQCRFTYLNQIICVGFYTEIKQNCLVNHLVFSQAQVVDLDHGMKDKNPIESVYFYSKRNPTEASPIKDYQVFMTLKLFYS